MTLRCTCGSYALAIISQSYPKNGNAYETYECELCGRSGSLTHNATTNATMLSGALENDWE